jgi:phage-related protein
MLWLAYQYGSTWDITYAACDGVTQELLDRRLAFLREHGNLSERPVSAPLGEGIFELRANTARMLFYFGALRAIIFVNCFVKKTRKVATEDIKLAKKRRTEILTQKVKANALTN